MGCGWSLNDKGSNPLEFGGVENRVFHGVVGGFELQAFDEDVFGGEGGEVEARIGVADL